MHVGSFVVSLRVFKSDNLSHNMGSSFLAMSEFLNFSALKSIFLNSEVMTCHNFTCVDIVCDQSQ